MGAPEKAKRIGREVARVLFDARSKRSAQRNVEVHLQEEEVAQLVEFGVMKALRPGDRPWKKWTRAEVEAHVRAALESSLEVRERGGDWSEATTIAMCDLSRALDEDVKKEDA